MPIGLCDDEIGATERKAFGESTYKNSSIEEL